MSSDIEGGHGHLEIQRRGSCIGNTFSMGKGGHIYVICYHLSCVGMGMTSRNTHTTHSEDPAGTSQRSRVRCSVTKMSMS